MESHLKNIFIRLKSRKVVYICSEIPVLFYFWSNFFSCIQGYEASRFLLTLKFAWGKRSKCTICLFIRFLYSSGLSKTGGMKTETGEKKLKRVCPSIHPSVSVSWEAFPSAVLHSFFLVSSLQYFPCDRSFTLHIYFLVWNQERSKVFI